MTRIHAHAGYEQELESSLIASGIADPDEAPDARESGEQTDMLTRARRRHREAPAQTSTGCETTPSADRKPAE